MVNPAMIFKIKSMWDEFTNQHPKLPRFFQAVASQPLEEGTDRKSTRLNSSHE